MTGSLEGTIGTHLCYLNTANVDGPAGALGHLDVQTVDGQEVGELDGVLIEPAARRIRYYVIALGRRFGRRRYLLSAEAPAQLETGSKALRFRIDLSALNPARSSERATSASFPTLMCSARCSLKID